MAVQFIAIGILVVIFAVATLRKVNIGLLALVGACAVGLWLASVSLADVVDKFPVNIMILLVGVTFFVGVAQVNGTLEKLVARGVAAVGDRPAMMPIAFFVLTGAISSMGSSLAGLVMFPVGMAVGARYRIDPVLMALSMGLGAIAGAFTPTSLFGIVTYGTATNAGVDLNPLVLSAIALVLTFGLLLVAMTIFGDLRVRLTRAGRAKVRAGGGPPARMAAAEPALAEGSADNPDSSLARVGSDPDPSDAAETGVTDEPFTRTQLLTTAGIALLIGSVVVLTLAGFAPNVGVLCLALGTGLILLSPEHAAPALRRIDWSTVLLVGGIITYVEVLEAMGAVDMLGRGAASVGAPLLAALLLCMIGGLVSAFVSTTGILAAVVPLAVPLLASNELPAWAVIVALAISSSLVDVSPFSTVGATLVATSPEPERPRVQSLLLRWGLSMVVIGPVLTVGLLVVPGVVAT